MIIAVAYENGNVYNLTWSMSGLLLPDDPNEEQSRAEKDWAYLKEMYPDIQVLSMIPDMRQSDKKNSYYSDYYGPVKSKQKGGADNGRKQGA